MNVTYDNLPEAFRFELSTLTKEAQQLGIEPKVLEALLLVPWVSDHVAQAERLAGQRLDTLRAALFAKCDEKHALIWESFLFALFRISASFPFDHRAMAEDEVSDCPVWR